MITVFQGEFAGTRRTHRRLRCQFIEKPLLLKQGKARVPLESSCRSLRPRFPATTTDVPHAADSNWLPKRPDILIESVGKTSRPSPTVSREVIYHSYPGKKKEDRCTRREPYRNPHDGRTSDRSRYEQVTLTAVQKYIYISKFVRI